MEKISTLHSFISALLTIAATSVSLIPPLYGHGRRLDVKADCLCKLCKGVMDGQRIRNLRRIASSVLASGSMMMVSPLTFTIAGIVAEQRYEQIDRNIKNVKYT